MLRCRPLNDRGGGKQHISLINENVPITGHYLSNYLWSEIQDIT